MSGAPAAAQILVPLPAQLAEPAGATPSRDTVLEASACTLLDDPTVATAPALAASTSIVLRTAPAASDGTPLGDEGFELISDGAISVTASAPAGAYFAMQALRQLCRAGRLADGGAAIAPVRIVDVPDQAWRELSLDMVRRFYPVPEVLRIIALAARFRLNRLHLHLTDDQGWRIEIPSHPELTGLGSLGAVDDRSGGFYTVADFSRIVDYAAARAITVVPEIDVPGHANALLVAHPELAADIFTDPVTHERGATPRPYHGIEVGFSCLDVDSDAARALLTDVFTDVAAITPGPYLHFGGDEVLTLPRERFIPFIRWVADLVRSLGKQPVAWHEAGWADLDSDVILQFWNLSDPEPIERTIVSGGQIVNFPSAHAYFDMKYSPDSRIGLTWAGVTSVRQSYEWEAASTLGVLDPAFALARVGTDRVDAVLASAAAIRAAATPASVLGVGGALWSETVESIEDAEWLLLPRLLAFAEVAWTPSSRRDWDDFAVRLRRQVAELRADGHTVFDPDADH